MCVLNEHVLGGGGEIIELVPGEGMEVLNEHVLGAGGGGGLLSMSWGGGA